LPQCRVRRAPAVAKGAWPGARFGRLQDTLVDKLLPTPLRVSRGNAGAAVPAVVQSTRLVARRRAENRH
jgi:hypothetical protein